LSFDEVEFRNHSQNGEDGILWYVFSLIGTTKKECVEICAGDGTQCNCANLIINHGWTGLLFDGDARSISAGQVFYRSHPDTFTYPPKLVHAWVTAENVNDLISANGFRGEVDLLSLDIDGVDYWVWKAIDAVAPRVVIAEVQAIWGCQTSVTVPYSPDFKAEFVQGFGVYSGASLPALVKLGKEKAIASSAVNGTVSIRSSSATTWVRVCSRRSPPNSACGILLPSGHSTNYDRSSWTVTGNLCEPSTFHTGAEAVLRLRAGIDRRGVTEEREPLVALSRQASCERSHSLSGFPLHCERGPFKIRQPSERAFPVVAPARATRRSPAPGWLHVPKNRTRANTTNRVEGQTA
jgi:hypothetical protein